MLTPSPSSFRCVVTKNGSGSQEFIRLSTECHTRCREFVQLLKLKIPFLFSFLHYHCNRIKHFEEGQIIFKWGSQIKLSHNPFKGACSEIIGKLIFFKLADMVSFPTKTSSWWKNCKYMYLICKQFLRKQCKCYLFFYKWWKPCFLISKRAFWWFLRNYTDFAH